VLADVFSEASPDELRLPEEAPPEPEFDVNTGEDETNDAGVSPIDEPDGAAATPLDKPAGTASADTADSGTASLSDGREVSPTTPEDRKRGGLDLRRFILRRSAAP
jgi:hypothetical protein